MNGSRFVCPSRGGSHPLASTGVLIGIFLLILSAFPATTFASSDWGCNADNVGAYSDSTFVIDSCDALWTWGDNSSGQLGDGTTEDRIYPVKIMNDVKSADIGHWSGAAVKNDGSLWTWGTNELTGVLGDGTETNHYTPVKVMDGVESVSVGFGFAAAVKTDGTLWTWGLNVEGSLGDGGDTTGYHLNRRPTPKQIMENVKSVSCGDASIAAVKDDESLWTWGDNDFGQLGNGETSPRDTPVRVLDGVKTAEVGRFNTYAIKTDGTLWVWGWNTSYGLVGDGSGADQYLPVQVLDDVDAAALGDYNVAAIRDDGTLWMWGDNGDGEVLGSSAGTVKTPKKVEEGPVSDVAIGERHFIMIVSGDMWVWGENERGQLGTNSTQGSYTPTRLRLHSDDYYTAEDTDEDGIPDDWERNGLDIDGDGAIDVDLAALGAEVGHRDLFVEVDFMKGAKLGQKQIEKVVDKFMERDIWLHVDAGPNSTDFATGEKWGDLSRSDTVDEMDMVMDSEDSGATTSDGVPVQYLWGNYVNENFSLERRPFFRHCLVVKKIVTVNKNDNGEFERNSISGISSDMPGQCFMIADWTDNFEFAPAATFMHELGHTLGLEHGGDDGVNYKPNHLSIMNYSFQLPGFYGTDDIDYCNHVLPSIDENDIDESQGIDPLGMYSDSKIGTRWYLEWSNSDGYPDKAAKPIAGNSIDFNHNGIIEESIQLDLNGDGAFTELHCPTTEWALLKFKGGSIGDKGAAAEGSRIEIAVDPAELNEPTFEQYEQAAEQAASEPSTSFEVTFDTNGLGTEPLPQCVFDGERAAVPQSPTEEDHVFAGWYIDEACTEEYDFDTPIVGDITLYAKWMDEEETPDAPDPDVPVEPDEPDHEKTCPSLAFDDIDIDKWYHKAVDWALEHEVMNGYGGTDLFGPDEALSREQAAAVLYNSLAGDATGAPETDHVDVDQNEWYAEAVNWAVAENVMNGYDGSDLFGVGDPLTREQFACVLANIAAGDLTKMDETVLSDFPDGAQVSEWAQPALAWAVENGVINGVEMNDGSRELQAGRTISRAEMAAMIMNASEKGVLTVN